METAHGVLSKHTKDPAQGRTLQAWLDRILLDFVDRIYPFTLDTALTAARISQGRTRGRADLLIAATAIAHDLPLATRNVRDFYDIPGLVVVNPWEHNPHDPAT
jgi:predicted nucleic acid-binding protein